MSSQHMFYINYDKGWTIEQLEKALKDARQLGATDSTVVRVRFTGTLGRSGIAGLEVALPLPARDAGSSTGGSASKGGDQIGERQA